jgi:two-component system, OmpR family, response regulator
VRILIADDDKPVANLMRRVLAEDGYAIDVAHSGEDARLLAFVNPYDGIVLDLELGDRHGFEVLQELRSAGKTTPVLLYTGTEDPSAIVRGLDAGADGYIVKPVTNQELRARVRSLLRRGPGARVNEKVIVGPLCLNRLTRRVTRGPATIDLTPMEMRLLEYLMLKAGQVVTRADLHDNVWDMHFDPSSNLVDAHVARLRKKLDRSDAGVSIVTRRGMGFVLDAGKQSEDDGGDQEQYGVNNAQA